MEPYMAANKMVINADKTHLMVMAPARLEDKRKKVALKAGNYTITPTESEKLLGVGIHQSMAWKHHISVGDGSGLKQVTSRVNGLKKLSHKADTKTKLMLANGIVISKLSYGLALWETVQHI